MSEIYNEMMKAVNKLNKMDLPLRNKTVLIPAKWEKNEKGVKVLVPINENLERVYVEAMKAHASIRLSEHVPTTDKDGKECVYVLDNLMPFKTSVDDDFLLK